jgi:hypothetical protein
LTGLPKRLACANHSKEALTTALPLGQLAMQETNTYIAPQVGQMQQDGDNILRNKV